MIISPEKETTEKNSGRFTSSKNGKPIGSIDKVLITGATGFLGSYFLPFFIKKHPKTRLIAVVRGRQRLNGLKKAGITIVSGDLRYSSTWSKLSKEITHVIHLAASVPVTATEKNDPSFFEKNLIPVRHLARASKKWPFLRQIIFASSVSVYKPSLKKLTEKDKPSPRGAYASAKLAGEIFLEKNVPRQCRLVRLRFSSLFGPGQSPGTVLPQMIADAQRSGRIHVHGTGKRVQDFIFVKDAAWLVEAAYTKNTAGIFNAGSGAPVSMSKLALKINSIFTGGRSRVIFHSDLSERPGYRVSTQKAVKAFGFSASSLENGLRSIKKESRAQ